MRNAFFAVVLVLFGVSSALAQTDVLIEIDRGRTEGVFTKTPVFQRAVLSKPTPTTKTALLFFRGNPGIARIQSAADKTRNLLPFMRMNQRIFQEEDIALVIMDCPTDQWGSPGPPNSCRDGYRSSNEHTDDVRSIITKLRIEHGLEKFYVMGHSMGTISSRWLAKNLGGEIAGSIHSAAMNPPNPRGYADSFSGFPYGSIVAPVLHVHNENDACGGTPYSTVRTYAEKNLVTVRGGGTTGDPCGGRHLHSHEEREELVVRAIISWIKTKKVDHVIGE